MKIGPERVSGRKKQRKKSPRCYYVHCPLSCGEKRRGHKCSEPWRRKGQAVPLQAFGIRR